MSNEKTSRPLTCAIFRLSDALAGAFSIEKEEDRLLLIKAIIHAADISNPVRPFHVNCVLSSGVHREFRWASTLGGTFSGALAANRHRPTGSQSRVIHVGLGCSHAF